MTYGEWQPIEAAPKDGTAVVLYFARRVYTDWETKRPIPYEGTPRQLSERCDIGFFEDDRWWEANTGHDLFEPWKDVEDLPTHWMPLPPPPVTP